MRFTNVKLFDEHFQFVNGEICVENGIFVDSSEGEIYDCTGLMALPGLVDIHTHGAQGFDAMDNSFDAIEALSRFHAQNGTTSFLPTIMTQSREVLTKSAENIFNAKSRVSGAKVGGIYMEGPYFSMKYKGGQNPEFIRCPDIDEFNTINAISHGLIKIVSIAPEVEGAEEFIRSVCPTVKVAAGHTDADYDTMLRAIEWGVGQLTHTFNTMRPLHHREPNAIGAALDGSVMCECIADGIHVHPVMVRLLYKAVGGERLVLVSDSVRPAGLTDGQYTSGGLKVFVKHGRIILENGDIAGGSTPLFECMKRAISFGVPIEDAVRAATYNPAKSAGIDEEVGTIKNGRAADFLLVDSDLNLKAVYIDGKKVY